MSRRIETHLIYPRRNIFAQTDNNGGRQETEAMPSENVIETIPPPPPSPPNDNNHAIQIDNEPVAADDAVRTDEAYMIPPHSPPQSQIEAAVVPPPP